MEPKNISALILSCVMCFFLVLIVYYLRRLDGLSRGARLRGVRDTNFGGIKRSGFRRQRRRTSFREMFRFYKTQHILVDFYFITTAVLFLYTKIQGHITPEFTVQFYFYSVIIGYSALYLEYKNQIDKYFGFFKFTAALIFSLSVLSARVLVDQNIQQMTDLPAAFFPNSQTALLVVFAPLIFFVVFTVLSLVIYIKNAYVVVSYSAFNKNFHVSLLVFHIQLFVIFMILTVGTSPIFSGLIGLGYNEFYEDSFVEYSYNLNKGTCKNLGDDVYVSHLSTGGVSVADKKGAGDYSYSVESCDRKLDKAKLQK